MQKLGEEVDQWEKKVDALNHMANKLVDEYNSDDVVKVKAIVEKDNNKWTSLVGRYGNICYLLFVWLKSRI